VGSDMADIVNSAEIPHLHCGIKTLSDDDEIFFDDLKSCVTKGDAYDACLGPSVTADGTACNWCVTVTEPYFASCFSEAFVTEAKDLDAATDMLSSIVDCSPEAPKEVGAIADTHCFTDGNPEGEFDSDVLAGVCSQTKDAKGNPCVVANLFGMIDMCVTDTQKSVLDYIVDQMGEMGITSPMSILGGEAGPAVFDEDGFGDHIPGVGEDADEENEGVIHPGWEENEGVVYVSGEEEGAAEEDEGRVEYIPVEWADDDTADEGQFRIYPIEHGMVTAVAEYIPGEGDDAVVENGFDEYIHGEGEDGVEQPGEAEDATEADEGQVEFHFEEETEEETEEEAEEEAGVELVNAEELEDRQ